MPTLVVRKLRAGTVYWLVIKGLFLGLVPLFAVFGVLACFDLFSLQWNGQPVTGLRALIVGPLMGALFALIGTLLFGSALAFGLWLHSLLGTLKIEYDGVEED